MKTEVFEVKTKGQVVGSVEVDIYDETDEGLQELLSKYSAKDVVANFNKSHKIELMGKERAKHSDKPTSKKAMFKIAFNLMTPDEAIAVAGDYDKLNSFLASEDMQNRVNAYLKEHGQSVDETDENEQ